MPVRDRLAELQKESKYVTDKDIKKMNQDSNTESIPMLPIQNMSPENREFFEKIEEIKEEIDTVRNPMWVPKPLEGLM